MVRTIKMKVMEYYKSKKTKHMIMGINLWLWEQKTRDVETNLWLWEQNIWLCEQNYMVVGTKTYGL
jgi:hypothetical protein